MKRCCICNSYFLAPEASTKKFCSLACKNKIHRFKFYIRKCVNCNQLFVTRITNSLVKTCGPKCCKVKKDKSRAENAANNGKRRIIAKTKCLVCESMFPKYLNVRTCSPECKNKWKKFDAEKKKKLMAA